MILPSAHTMDVMVLLGVLHQFLRLPALSRNKFLFLADLGVVFAMTGCDLDLFDNTRYPARRI